MKQRGHELEEKKRDPVSAILEAAVILTNRDLVEQGELPLKHPRGPYVGRVK